MQSKWLYFVIHYKFHQDSSMKFDVFPRCSFYAKQCIKIKYCTHNLKCTWQQRPAFYYRFLQVFLRGESRRSNCQRPYPFHKGRFINRRSHLPGKVSGTQGNLSRESLSRGFRCASAGAKEFISDPSVFQVFLNIAKDVQGETGERVKEGRAEEGGGGAKRRTSWLGAWSKSKEGNEFLLKKRASLSFSRGSGARSLLRGELSEICEKLREKQYAASWPFFTACP